MTETKIERKERLYRRLSYLVDAYHRCVETKNEFGAQHAKRIEALVKEHMPSGGGFDAGTRFDLDASTGEKLIFTTAFHHMNEGGYDGWTEHTVTVTSSLQFDWKIVISGRDRNGIKEYIHECFGMAMVEMVTW